MISFRKEVVFKIIILPLPRIEEKIIINEEDYNRN